MKTGRAIAWIVAAASAAVLAYSSWQMSVRVSEFHKSKKREVFAFQTVSTREFSYAGRPVRLSDEDDAAGQWIVKVQYGDDEIRLPVAVPGERRLPDLLPYSNWLLILRFASATGMTLDALTAKMDRGEVRDRLVILTRTPEPGSEPSSWGEVNRHAWKFDFYELKPEGGFEHERKSFPVKARTIAKIKEGPAPDELKENTWEFQAALQIMPPAKGPSPRFTDDGLHSMGWTLPATSCSMLSLIAALLIALAPDRRVAPTTL